MTDANKSRNIGKTFGDEYVKELKKGTTGNAAPRPERVTRPKRRFY